ncbi:MAG TPA: hypothetical protein VHP63_01700 [candidate division Zixibacteria bacterium]|nr:hypothetical protein [candidate division Zixibacteria bacterium]
MIGKLVQNSLLALLLCTSVAFSNDYWQQEVNYKMSVALQKDLRTIDGTIEIEYINNSPDSLDRLYIKAFPNAIQRDSYADQKLRRMNDYSFANLKPEEEGLLELKESTAANKPYVKLTQDNTIYTVQLAKALSPGDTLYLTFDFKTVLPSPHNMRMGLEQNTTKAAYWYPQVCVYDRKMGWVNSQYINWGETYGDFGKFDVKITVPENQVVAATGILVNEKEVLPDSLKKLLHISSFTKPKEEWP